MVTRSFSIFRSGLSGLVLTLVVLLPGCAHRMPPDQGEALVIETEDWHFGTIERGETTTGHLTLANRGRDTLQVILHPSCDCLSISPSEVALAPYGRVSLGLTYIGDEIKSPVTKTVFITYGTRPDERLAFTVTGNVLPGNRPHLVAVPDPLPLDPSDPSYPIADLTLTNLGTETLEIKDVTCFGCIDSWTPKNLGWNDEAVLEITPLPDWNERRWIEIESNDPVQPLKRIAIVDFD
jgi:hypothetical protein